MSHAHDSGHGDHDRIGHVAPLRMLILTAVLLFILTWLTVFVVNFDFGEANIYIALGIAVVKAALVGLYFMHLRWDRPFNAMVCIGSIAGVALFVAISMTDTSQYADQISAYVDTELVQKEGTPDSPAIRAAVQANDAAMAAGE